MARMESLASVATPASAPRYELRVRTHGTSDTEYEIWQLPAPATPHVSAPIRIAGLRGRNLELIEHRVLRRLAGAGIRPGPSADRRRRGYALGEDTAVLAINPDASISSNAFEMHFMKEPIMRAPAPKPAQPPFAPVLPHLRVALHAPLPRPGSFRSGRVRVRVRHLPVPIR